VMGGAQSESDHMDDRIKVLLIGIGFLVVGLIGTVALLANRGWPSGWGPYVLIGVIIGAIGGGLLSRVPSERRQSGTLPPVVALAGLAAVIRLGPTNMVVGLLAAGSTFLFTMAVLGWFEGGGRRGRRSGAE
jgi:hypothetical protein